MISLICIYGASIFFLAIAGSSVAAQKNQKYKIKITNAYVENGRTYFEVDNWRVCITGIMRIDGKHISVAIGDDGRYYTKSNVSVEDILGKRLKF